MTHRVLEMVPNFSEGRDSAILDEIVRRVESVRGVEVVDGSSDPDHHRSVLTALGPPEGIAEAAVRAAAVAVERIDLRRHSGVHPRVGALDVLPFVPLLGLTEEETVDLARRTARRLAEELGLPVYLYGAASDPPGRPLAEIRGRGAERAIDALPNGRTPDVVPDDWSRTGLHPTAGAVCLGVRGPLLAWNVDLEGGDLELASRIAREIRERGGGFRGLRALGLELKAQGRVQISMNLETPEVTSAAEVYETIDRLARAHGARAGATEVIGLIPDAAAAAGAAAFWKLRGPQGAGRLLASRVLDHVARRSSGLEEIVDRLRRPGPPGIGSALAWAGVLAAAVMELSGDEAVRKVAAECGQSLTALAERDAEAYRRFLVSDAASRLELWREATGLPLEIAREAGRLRDAAQEGEPAGPSLRLDLEGAFRLANTVAVEAARLALADARRGGASLADLEGEARRLLEHLERPGTGTGPDTGGPDD